MKLAVSVSLPAVGIILLAALLHNVAGAHNMDLGKALHERSLSAPGRELKASSLRDSLVKRHTEFRLTNEVALNYAEGSSPSISGCLMQLIDIRRKFRVGKQFCSLHTCQVEHASSASRGLRTSGRLYRVSPW